MTTSHTFIFCSTCDARVQAKVLAEREYSGGEDWEPHKYSFVECMSCKRVLVGYSEWGMVGPEDDGWTSNVRLWPDPDTYFHMNIPPAIRRSLEEANTSFKAKAYMACAVMCGRAVEGICKEKVGAKYLADGLLKLKEAKIIDQKLFEWGEALRAERNIGAHAGDETISGQDANDVLDFATAISEYV